MSTLVTTIPAPLSPPLYSLKRFTVGEYHRMIDSGVFDDDQPVELLEGWIAYKMGHNPPHDVAVKLVSSLLDRILPAGWHTRVQSAMTTRDSEPLPDIAVVRGNIRDYLTHHPTPADAAVLIEVCDSTLDDDRDVKGPLYARAGVELYWIVNLRDTRVEVYSQPKGKGAARTFSRVEKFGIRDSVELQVGKNLLSAPVRDMLP